jgi:WD40 repeat protein
VAILNRLYGPRPKRNAARTWKLRRAVVQHAIAFSADGALLATGDGAGKICVRDAATGRTVRTLRTAPAASTHVSLAFTRPGRLIAALAERAGIRIWDATNKRLLYELELGGGNAPSLALSSNASWLAVGSADGTVRRLQANGRSVGAWVKFGPASLVAVSPDGRYVASAGPRTQVRVWSFPAGLLVGRLSVGRGIT